MRLLSEGPENLAFTDFDSEIKRVKRYAALRNWHSYLSTSSLSWFLIENNIEGPFETNFELSWPTFYLRWVCRVNNSNGYHYSSCKLP